MKKGFLIFTVIVLVCALGAYGLLFSSARFSFSNDRVRTDYFRTKNNQIQIFRGKAWEPFEILGVNMGTGYPGLFPNEFGISEETYYRWFEQISAMHANTVRVYKIQSPSFYRALCRFNESRDQDRLYLIQGMDFTDHVMFSEENLLSPQVKEKIFEDTCEMVSALHGDEMILDLENSQLNFYIHDVSKYVLGYILGVEWDEMFVQFQNDINAELPPYQGRYLSCGEEANAFESFLAEWGDRVLSFEQSHYGKQTLISYCNWPATDPLINEFEFKEMDVDTIIPDSEATVDLEHIHATREVRSGLFASYNVYPYFPYFLQTGPYTHYIDDEGRQNPYRKYLMELVAHHQMPVIITEYGVPASRNPAYEDVWRGIDHGGLNETQQGEALLEMFGDIQKAGCAGSIVFAWNDEPYKKAWNEKKLSDPDRRAFWTNAMCSEQFFGILAFEPGDGKVQNYPDGDLSEWSEKHRIFQQDGMMLSMKSDEKYVYFLAEGLDHRAGKNLVNIALDVTPKTGAEVSGAYRFERPVDFLIRIGSDGTGEIRVHEDSDVLMYSSLGGYNEASVYMADKIRNSPNIPQDASGFNVITRASGNINSTMRAQWVLDEVGRLKMGNANPLSDDYDSNADYFVGDDFAEIRIPWQQLNFYDPSGCKIIGDFNANGYKIEPLKIGAIFAAAYYDDASCVEHFGSLPLKPWDEPRWHERLKDSYYILQEGFKEVIP